MAILDFFRSWTKAANVAPITAFLLFATGVAMVSSKLTWDCEGNKKIFEDHVPGENNPIVTATDPDGSTFILQPGPVFKDLIEIKTIGDKTIAFLTRSIEKQIFNPGIILFLTTSAQTDACVIMSEAVNLNWPVFTNTVFRQKIEENQASYEFYVGEVDDEDLRRGKNPAMHELKFWIEYTDAPTDLFLLEGEQHPTSKNYTLKIKVTGKLDFETQRLHRLHVFVEDKSEDRPNPLKVHRIETTIDVEVQDVHDQPPQFTTECGLKNIEEHTPVAFVTTVKAIDGDTQMNNIFKYKFPDKEKTNGERLQIAKKYFQVNEKTGQVTIKKDPDRESEDFLTDSSIFFNIEAIEYKNEKTIEEEPNTISTACYFQITDIDDSPPVFDKEFYNVDVEEHSPVNFPLHFEHPPFVVDKDVGVNATYTLSLEGEGSQLFSVIPKDGQNNVSFSIRVHDTKRLDYESPSIPNHKLIFKIRAVGKLNQTFTDEAELTVNIEDINDNAPIFTSDLYEVLLNENVVDGQIVLTVTATDVDTNDFGTAGIRYSILTKQQNFEIDNVTGVIKVKEGHGIDREVQEDLYLTVQATDNLGKGTSTSAQVYIQVEDYNDQKPYFLIKNYKTILYENENKTEADIQLQARDDDKPNTTNSEVNFRLLTHTKFFAVHKSSGVVSLKRFLDFEEIDPDFPEIYNKNDRVWKRVFELKVEAYDLGIPQQVSDEPAIIVVDFVDVNDNVPVFDKTSLRTTINETIEKRTELEVTLKATDRDLSNDYNKVFYSFHGEPHSSFLVDRATGKLRISPSPLLAPEDNGNNLEHVLVVEATDGLLNQDPDKMCSVTVTVIDVNNQKPIFGNPTVIKEEVWEEQKFHEPMATFTATDVDQSNRLQYTIDYKNSRAEAPNRTAVSMTNYDYSKCFFIDSDTGNLTVIEVDREEIKMIDLLIMVEDMAAEINHPQTATTWFKITVLDINDNDPHFLNKNVLYGYNASIVENRQDSHFLKIEAADRDEYNEITYSLELDPQIYNINASIDPKSGVIDFGPVDYEEHHQVTFAVVATDNDPKLNRSSNATVTVFVEDVNDNKPVFDPEVEYAVKIPEHTPVGELIFTLSASDNDTGQFGLVHYRISSNNKDSDSKYFQIANSYEGNVTILISPDFEELSTNVLVVLVEAFDNPFAISNNQHATSEQLRVTVLDINDNEPVFEVPSKCLEVDEDNELNMAFATIVATDRDEPGSNNSFVEYHVMDVRIPSHVKPGGGHYFRLDMLTGKLDVSRSLLNIPLKGTDPVFNLTLMAKDRGDPPLNSTAEFCVFVKDINNFAPVFTYPDPKLEDQSFSFYEAKEGSPTLGRHVTTVKAEDNDWDLDNHRITFNFADPTSPEAKKHFKLNSGTGDIEINYNLKQDEIKEYRLTIQACDNPKDSSSQLCTNGESHANIVVLVKSEQDSVPKFLNRTNQKLEFTEHSQPGNETQFVPEARFDDVVEKPPKICYSVIGGDRSLFKLDENTRELTVTQDLDREEHSHHWIAVKAHDLCDRYLPEEDLVQALKGLDTVNITIKLIDINDQAPKFVFKNFTAGISSSSNTRGEKLKTHLEAFDNDEGENALFEYRMVGKVDIVGENMEALIYEVAGTGQQPFSVNKDNGEIVINFSANKDMKGHFLFHVEAVDRADNKDTALVLIYLMRDDQQIIVHIQKSLTQITPDFLNAFSGAVRDVTKFAFNVDNYMAYTGNRPELKNSSSTLWAHLVNTSNNHVLDAKDSLKVINQHFTQLSQKTQSVGGSLLGADEKKEETPATESDYMMIVLFAVIGTLVIALSLTCGIFVYKLKGSNRKLKAAKVVTYGNEEEIKKELSLASAPNTNVFTEKGSNPIWTDIEPAAGHFELDAARFNIELDIESVSSIDAMDLPDFEPTANPLFEENVDDLDGVLNLGFVQHEDKSQDVEHKDKEQTKERPKIDTISNLKKAEEKWRQKKAEAPSPTIKNDPFKFHSTRKKMDYFPENEEESDL